MSSSSDSVSLFAEGTFEEQIRELVEYLARGLTDESRIAFIKPFSEGLVTPEGAKTFDEDPERRRKVVVLVLGEVKGLGSGNEREIEGFFNLLFAHVLSLFPDTNASRERLKPLIAVVSSASTENPSIQYRVLTNLFNALPRTSPLRLEVYTTLLTLASSHQDLDVLQISKSSIETWFAEWEVNAEQKSALLKSIGDAFSGAGKSEQAYTYYLLRAESSPSSPSSQSQSQSQSQPQSQSKSQEEEIALDILSTALRLPVSFDLIEVTKIPVIQLSAKSQKHPIYALLEIFTSPEGLKGWEGWKSGNGAVLTQFKLDAAEVEKKLRFLALVSLAAKHIGQDLSYSAIASALNIDPKSVEVWVIDAIRAKILSGKLSQPTQSFHVAKASSISRPFSSKSQWQSLETKLVSWRAGLVDVLGVVANAKEEATSRKNHNGHLNVGSGGGGGGGSGGGKGAGVGGEDGKEGKEKSGPIVHGDLAPTNVATAIGSHAPATEAAGAA